MTQDLNSQEFPSPIRLEDWSFDHFICLLLLYASYADYEYSDKERAHILTIIDSQILDQIEKLFYTLGEFEQLDLIVRLKQRFITCEGDRKNLFDLLHRHFHSDGAFTRLESGLYQFLQRLL